MDEQQSDQLTAHLWSRRCAAIHRLRLSVLYHLRRERWYDLVDKWIAALTAMSATAAAAVLLNGTGSVEKWIAGLAALLSLVPLVFQPSQKARAHAQAAAQFRAILADCEKVGEHWTAEQCNHFASTIVQAEATEPATLSALVADCENQLALANGGQPVAQVRWYHGLTMHFLNLRPDPA